MVEGSINVIDISALDGNWTLQIQMKTQVKSVKTNLSRKMYHVNREQDVAAAGKVHQNSRSCKKTELD